MKHALNWLSFFLFVLSCIACAGSNKNKSSAGTDKRPNIVLIMADDLGYSDIGCYGGEINTPNLDYLAQNGMRFTGFYNTSRCCPTRAALLTGLYNHQAGIGEMTSDRNLPGYRGHLTENAVTMAEVLKNAGYRTAMSGKWHVSNTIEQPTAEAQMDWLNHKANFPLFSPIDQYPTNKGFERYFGNIWGVVNFFDPFSLVSGTTPIEKIPKDYYHTDAINDSAVSYINEFSKGDRPFFLYVAQTAPHWPLHALPEDIKKYQNTYTVGWDAIRESRYKRMIEKGLIDSNTTPLSPRIDSELSWDANPDKEWDARAMAVHAAMIDRMDQGIGRIISALRQAGELENTIIVFLSDNGASPENAMRYGPGFDRPGETRDGRKIHYPVNKKILPGPDTTFTSIGYRWANVSNAPYRYAKAESYEGGVRTPMIAFWPEGIKSKGTISHHIGHVIDFMPTFLEAANADYPTAYNTHSVTPLAGISFLPVFKGETLKTHEALFNEHFGARSVRNGEWKLVSLVGDTTWRLYRMSEDQTETKDLAGQYPQIVTQLAESWRRWANEKQVFPKRKN